MIPGSILGAGSRGSAPAARQRGVGARAHRRRQSHRFHDGNRRPGRIPLARVRTCAPRRKSMAGHWITPENEKAVRGRRPCLLTRVAFARKRLVGPPSGALFALAFANRTPSRTARCTLSSARFRCKSVWQPIPQFEEKSSATRSRVTTFGGVLDNRDPVRSVDHEPAEAEAQAALARRPRERVAMSAREFVSERDALEDAWAGSPGGRDEGW